MQFVQVVSSLRISDHNRVQTEFVVDKFTFGNGFQFSNSQSIVYLDTEVAVS
jgi:hypothetical protein